MMNEYEKQALDFCNKWGVKIKWLFVGIESNAEWGDNTKRNHWLWTLSKDGKSTHGEFWDSIANTETSYQSPDILKEPSKYDLLACLTKYKYEAFEDFCCELGYDEDSRKAYHTWEKVNQEYDGLMSVFGNNKELWEEFGNIC